MQPPARCEPCWSDSCTERTINLGWKDLAEDAPDEQLVEGYELEVAEVSVLDGLGAFKRIDVGTNLDYTVRGLLAETEVHVQIRAYNRVGAGEWSDVVVLRSGAAEEEVLQAITEIPELWRTVDIDDVLKEEEKAKGVTPTDNWELLLAAFSEHSAVIKVAFCYYKLAGASASTDADPSTMNMAQFLNFAKGAALVDTKSTISDFDRLFMRAVRAVPAGRTSLVEQSGRESAAEGAPVGKSWGKAKLLGSAVSALASKAKEASKLMKQHHFVGALVRLSRLKYGGACSSLAECLQKLCTTHLDRHVWEDLQLVTDSFTSVMEGKLMQAVLRKHDDQLRRVFGFYAGQDMSLDAQGAAGTVNCGEMAELCEDIGIFDSKFGMREMIAAFVKVNIDDELYEQDDAENTSSELVLDEFTELLARMYLKKEWERKSADEQEAAQSIEFAFDLWLADGFLPSVFRAIKERKKGPRVSVG